MALDRQNYAGNGSDINEPYQAAASRYDATEYRRAGTTGLFLPPLSLGLWYNFGDNRPFQTMREVARRAFDGGITHFDLANNYGPPPGSAEENFGRILAKDLGRYRDELIISTKAGYRMHQGPYGEWGSRKALLSSLDASLGRMGLDYVDIMYSHRPDPDTPVEETVAALDAAVRSGKALYGALSNYTPEQTAAAVAVARDLGVPLVLHQPRYSMLDRRPEPELARVTADAGIGMIAFSSLAQGLLTDRYLAGVEIERATPRPFFDPKLAASEEMVTRLQGLAAVAKQRGQSLSQLALSWLLQRPNLTSALIGVSTVAQLEENLGVLAAAPLSEAELAEIDRHIAAQGEALV